MTRAAAVFLLLAAAGCSWTTTIVRSYPTTNAGCDRGTLGFEPGAGATVSEVLPDSPAARAGIQKGDVVVQIGDQAISNECEIIDAAFDRSGCDAVVMTIRRDGTTMKQTIVPTDEASFYARTCKDGNATACFRLAWLTWSGSGVPKSENRALELYAGACAAGSAEACAYRGLHLSERDEAPEEVVTTLKRACDLGSSAGCAHLAFLYATGKSVTRDDARATPLYVRACDLGDPRGCYNVGVMYEEGRGVAVDLARAVAAYTQGCRDGSSTACTNLGYLYEHGTGVAKDEQRAFDLYRRGCDGTSCQPANLRGCVNAGRAYRDGIGVPQDPKHAAEIFQDVAQRRVDSDDVDGAENRARATALLGALYLAGEGVETDLDRGRKLSEHACEADDSFGCFNAARVYANALGVDEDLSKAADFYDMACRLGDGEGCFEAARQYEEGHGVEVDHARAAELFKKACAAGFEAGCKRP